MGRQCTAHAAPNVTHGSATRTGANGMTKPTPGTHRRTVVGLVAVMLAASSGTAMADWKADAAKRTVGRAARAGMENAAKEAAVGAALGAVPARPAARGDIGGGRPAEPPPIGAAAGEGIEAAMSAANVASSIDAALEVADAAKRVNKARKAIR
jgi:hypothetical protein